VYSAGPLEQLGLTTLNGSSVDVSEYLLYSAKIPAAAFRVGGGTLITLEIASRRANAFVVFVGSHWVGSVHDAAHAEGAVSLKAELNVTRALVTSVGADDQVVLSLLSVSLGMYHLHVISTLIRRLD
jgi:hypothetical protein